MEEEYSEPDMPIPLVEVDMVVDDTPLVFPDEPVPAPIDEDDKIDINTFANEMIEDGLISSDMLYLSQKIKKLEDVRTRKLHCTACNKHLGTAPNDASLRLKHPLLKVLMCSRCADFYSSGEFLKDQDGSELYCRWCGEGGQVFCCTKCPFVFCKRCITRNVGRTKAANIQSSADWMCFACNPSQIDRFRGCYWAVQKYSFYMLDKYKDDLSNPILSEDASTCCSAKKRASEKKKPPKRRKLDHNNTPKPKPKRTTVEEDFEEIYDDDEDDEIDDFRDEDFVPAKWQKSCSSSSDSEVVCTPDIIPIDDSPVPSPQPSVLPPVPVLRPIPTSQLTPAKKLPTTYPVPFPPLVPIVTTTSTIRIVAPANLYSKPKLTQPPTKQILLKPIPILQQSIQKIVHKKVSSPGPSNTPPVVKISEKKEEDWFDLAAKHCSEVTSFISNKINGLSEFHTRSHSSTTLAQEMHGSLQSHLDAVITKLNNIKTLTKQKFDENLKEMEKKIPLDPVKIVLKKKKLKKSRSEKKDSMDLTLDLEVTNESDENLSSDESSRSPSPSSAQRISTTPSPNAIITVEDSDEEVCNVIKEMNVCNVIKEMNVCNVAPEPSIDIFKKLKDILDSTDPKVGVDISNEELMKILTAIVIIKNTMDVQKSFGSIDKAEKEPDIENMILENAKKNMSLDAIKSRAASPNLAVDTNMVVTDVVDANAVDTAVLQNSDEAVANDVVSDSQELESSQKSPVENNEPEKDKEITENHSDATREKTPVKQEVPFVCEMKEGEFPSKIVQNSSNDNSAKEEDTQSKISNDSLTDDEELMESSADPHMLEEVERMDEQCDIEDVISCSVITRKTKPVTPFEDNIDPTVLFLSDIGSDTIDRQQINIARALDFIPDDVTDIMDKDNGSLSLPPDSTDFCIGDIVRDLKLVTDKDDPENLSLFSNSHDQKSNNTDAKNESSNNASIEDILELRQIAEQCVK